MIAGKDVLKRIKNLSLLSGNVCNVSQWNCNNLMKTQYCITSKSPMNDELCEHVVLFVLQDSTSIKAKIMAFVWWNRTDKALSICTGSQALSKVCFHAVVLPSRSVEDILGKEGKKPQNTGRHNTHIVSLLRCHSMLFLFVSKPNPSPGGSEGFSPSCSGWVGHHSSSSSPLLWRHSLH